MSDDVEPAVKTPWNTRMSPDEFEDYYERKRDKVEQECKRGGCDETVQWPRRYCCSTCESVAMQKAAREFRELLEGKR